MRHDPGRLQTDYFCCSSDIQWTVLYSALYIRRMTAWDFRRWGTLPDPIHKSQLNGITGDYGCPKQFRYQMDARYAEAGDTSDTEVAVSGKTACGTAAHETIARALTVPDSCRSILAGRPVNVAQVQRVFREEFERETRGREVRWYKDKAETVLEDRVHMVTGLLNDLHRHVHSVEMVEPGFIVECGGYWLSGHIDLIYRPWAAPHKLAMCDWKTTSQKPIDLELDHSWEAGVYSAALQAGVFLPREALQVTQHEEGDYTAIVPELGPSSRHVSRYVAERNALEGALIELGAAMTQGPPLLPPPPGMRTFNEFPSRVHYVALQDYVPYKKAGSKPLTRREDLDFFGTTTLKYKAGDRRGPAWLPVRITEHDVPRLQARLKNVVGMIRMGRFVEQVGERCRRCHWAEDCLNSGYAAKGTERTALERQLKLLGDTDADAADLSVD